MISLDLLDYIDRIFFQQAKSFFKLKNGYKLLGSQTSKQKGARLRSIDDLKPEANQIDTNMDDFAKTAEQFRDNIWALVENWMSRLSIEQGEHSWMHLPREQVVDCIPTLLRGISKVIEDPSHLIDFEDDGVIHRAAAELGRNRRDSEYKSSELLREQEILRDIIWDYCRQDVRSQNLFELERRVNRPLDKIGSTIVEHYVNNLASELKYLSRRDKITGFLNYEAFREEITGEARRSRRYRHPFSLIIVEVDNFGHYLEEYGNKAADDLIYEVSSIVAHAIRNVDIPVRHSASVIAIILPETSKKQARKVAERIRRSIKLETRHAAQVRGSLKEPITISAGISTYPKDSENTDEIISLADEALFEAKKAGNDMVVWN